MPSQSLRSLCLLALAVNSVTGAPTGSIVTVNADKVLVLNGRKVFPIGFSPGPPTNGKTPIGKDALQELRDAGGILFRMTQTANWGSPVIADQQAALDWAAQHGMYGWVNLRELSKFAAGDATTEASLRNIVDTFRNHPALGLWKNFDEAWWGGVSVADLQRGYDVIKQEDTNHPIVQTHAPRGTASDLQPYNAAADVLALDIYPVGVPPGTHSLLPNKEISMVGDWTKFLSQVANGQKEYWMIEQIAWSGVTPPAHTLIFPTIGQERFMAYQAIINGARGLTFFGGNIASTLNARDTPLGWNWTFWEEILKPVVREIGDHSILANALVAPVSLLPITMSGTTSPDVEFTVRESPPFLYILACKREGATTNVTFSGLPTWATNGEVLFESSRAVTAPTGQFSDTFAPFEVHVYRFAQSNQPPVIISPPQSGIGYPGMPFAFEVTADGSGPLTYQWRKGGVSLSDGANVSGATTPVLNLLHVSQSDAGSFDVVVTGSGSVTSAPPAVLTVVNYQSDQVPTITAQPQSRTNYPGTTATFSLAISGNGPFAYQWRKNGINLSDGAIVSGTTSWNVILSNVSASDAAGYDVVVTGFTSVTSAPPAALAVVASQTNQLFLYEPFAYTNIGAPVGSNTPANWTYNGAGTNDLMVAGGNLSYAGLAPSVGNSVTNGGVGLGARRLFTPVVTNGAVYFSALLRINSLGYGTWNGAASQVGALTATDNATFRVAVLVKSNSAAGYVIGVQKGGSGATATFESTERHAGETIMLVGKYDFTVAPNPVSLWINPGSTAFGSATAPTNAFIFATTGTDAVAIDRFNIRQNTASSVPAAMQWDELRVGGSWGDVTPRPPPSPTLLTDVMLMGDGSLQFYYTNSGAQNSRVYASTNLADWALVGAATQVGPALYRFSDNNTSNQAQRFYQLKSE